jgi:hypothetical protein
MKTTLFAALLLSAAATAATADVSILENRKTVEVDCTKDKEVTLIGNHNRAVLKGTCAKVSITGNHCSVVGSTSVAYVAGNHNVLTLDASDTMTLAGNHNTLSYKRAVGKQPPKVSNVGKYNKVSQVR